jgi:hypothetical protein
MKVKELIEQLQKFDPELPVMIQGYEGGIDAPEKPYQTPIRLNVHEEWYYGKHEIHNVTDAEKADCEAIILPRG